jgi:hypothetical protein
VLLATLVPGCVGTSACTELGCSSEALVTFPAGLVSGAYDLVLEGETETVTARCLDPAAPETVDNPPELRCDAQGFMLDGHPLANERELVVTVIPDEGEMVSEPVRLEAIMEITPNGPDCPPTCVERQGQLRVGVGS